VVTDQPSLFTLTEQTHRDFDRVLATIPPGRVFDANEIRDLMDAADIPTTARGPLLNAACRRGLIEWATHEVAGRRCYLTVPSTGESAKGAKVAVYVRRAA
jgi:hypothetical protein